MNLETVLSIIAGGIAFLAAAWAADFFYGRLFNRWVQLQSQRKAFRERDLALRQQEQDLALDAVRVLRPDEHGRQGIVYNGQAYINLDTYTVFDEMRVQYFDPLMEQVNALQKSLLALQGAAGPAARHMLEAQTPPALPLVWPRRVELAGLFGERQPSLHRLIIGVRPSAPPDPLSAGGTTGDLDVVSLGIHELMHTLAVGASGWGKSTWLRALLWQVAQAPEPVEVVAVDTAGSEFNVLHGWRKLRWPVARTSQEARAVLGAVSDEIGRRKRLFQNNAPLATKLTEYNQATGAGLPPWLVVVDEGTALLNQPGVGEPLRAAVQTARQYGVYVLVAGQSAKHSVIDTQTRDNFTSRLCFRTSPTSSRVVLDDRAASELTQRGRMWAQLVGREQVELQGPFVGRQAFLAALDGGGPRQALPQAADDGTDDDQAEQIKTLHAQGESLRAIQKAVFGYAGGAAYDQVKRVLRDG